MLLRRGAAAEESPPDRVSIAARLSSESTRAEAIRLALRERGYIEGQNIAIEYRYAEGKRDRLPELAAELVRLKVDIIVAAGADRADPGGQECDQDDSHRYDRRRVRSCRGRPVESLARPGGNVTGLTNLARELGGKRLELLKEAVPKVARVAVLYEPANPASVPEVKEVLPVAARALGLTIQPWEVRAADDFDKVFAAMSKQRPDGLYVLGGSPLILLTKNGSWALR